MTDEDLVKVSEDGEGQENDCPVCGAEPGQMCNGIDPDYPDLGVEYGRLVHRARLHAYKSMTDEDRTPLEQAAAQMGADHG